jgi:negative regulator of sigma E activity
MPPLGSTAPPRRRQKQNYIGTIVYQHGGRFETSRLVHINDQGAANSRSSSISTVRRGK